MKVSIELSEGINDPADVEAIVRFVQFIEYSPSSVVGEDFHKGIEAIVDLVLRITAYDFEETLPRAAETFALGNRYAWRNAHRMLRKLADAIEEIDLDTIIDDTHG